jgi:hypothetical protein
VLRHRLMTNFNAEADQISADTIIENLIKETQLDGVTPSDRKLMESVMR